MCGMTCDLWDLSLVLPDPVLVNARAVAGQEEGARLHLTAMTHPVPNCKCAGRA